MAPPRSVAPRRRFVLGFFLVAALAPAAETGPVDYFADNGYGNTVSTLHHPAAEHRDGVTYVAYSGPHEDPYVAAYDHRAGRWHGPFQAGVNPMGKTPDQIDPGELDNHGRPALIVDRQGYVHVVFGGHGGDAALGRNEFGLPGKGRQIHAVTRRPGDISVWEVRDNISPFGTYGQWVLQDDGTLYLFYRHGSHRGDWVYQKSTDDGRTFAPPVPVLRSRPDPARPAMHDSWYAWFDRGLGATITASYVYHPCANPGHTAQRRNTYYMQLDGRDGTWTDVRGGKLAVPLTKADADARTLIVATGDEKSNHGSCHVDAAGNPHIFFRFAGGQMRYVRWDGTAWQGPRPVAAGYGRGSDGDFAVAAPTSVRAWLAQSRDGNGEVNVWETDDGGAAWRKTDTLFVLPAHGLEATTLVRNAHPDARMLVGSQAHESEHLYRRMYLIGDRGPIGRPAAEASHLGDRLERIKALRTGRPKAEAKKKKRAAVPDEER